MYVFTILFRCRSSDILVQDVEIIMEPVVRSLDFRVIFLRDLGYSLY